MLDAALVLPSLVCTMGLVQGAHIVESIGSDLSTYVEMLSGSLVPLIERDIRRQGHAIGSNDFGDTEASLFTWAAGADHMIRGLQEQGINVELIEPIRQLLCKAVRAGYGDEEVSAVIKVLRRGPG